MKKPFTYFATLLVIALLGGCASSSTNQVQASPTFGLQTQRSIHLMDGYSADYEKSSSPSQLVDWSQVAVFGEVEGFVPGRKWYLSNSDGSIYQSVFLKLRILKDISKVPNFEQKTVYVEINQSLSNEIDDYNVAIPKGTSMIAYLEPAQKISGPNIKFVEETQNLGGTSIYRFISPEGWILGFSLDNSVVWPLLQAAKHELISDELPGK